MFSKKLLIGSLLTATALLTKGTTEVLADPIRTSGVVCSNANPGGANAFQRIPNALVNVSPVVQAAVCAIPRSPPLPAGAAPVFQVTGIDANCVITSYQQNGATTAAVAIVWPAAVATAVVAFPPALAPPPNYITLFCNVNPGGAILDLAAAN